MLVKKKSVNNETHMKLTSFIAWDFSHLIIRQKCFIRHTVPTFIFATVNVTPRLQCLLHKYKHEVS